MLVAEQALHVVPNPKTPIVLVFLIQNVPHRIPCRVIFEQPAIRALSGTAKLSAWWLMQFHIHRLAARASFIQLHDGAPGVRSETCRCGIIGEGHRSVGEW